MAVKCTICGRTLRSQYNLKIHMAVHTGKKPHKCDICGNSFQQRWNLVTHVSRVHAAHRPFQCDDCGRRFGYKSHFKAHIRSHFLAQLEVPEPIKNRLLHPYTCSICNRAFETPSLVKQHEEMHTTPRVFTCDTCGKQRKTKRSIAKHVLNCFKGGPKSGDKKNLRKEPIPCEICGKKVARYSMHKHMNIHTRKRIYPCTFCGKEFLEAGNKEIHERTHTGTKPYKCYVCSRAFAQKGNLFVHYRRCPKDGAKKRQKKDQEHDPKGSKENACVEKSPSDLINLPTSRNKATNRNSTSTSLRNLELVLELKNSTNEVIYFPEVTAEVSQTSQQNLEAILGIDNTAKTMDNGFVQGHIQSVQDKFASEVIKKDQDVIRNDYSNVPELSKNKKTKNNNKKTAQSSINPDNMELVLELTNITNEDDTEVSNTDSQNNSEDENVVKSGIGVTTIHEFVELASEWITTKNQEPLVEPENPTPQKWTKRGKQEIWEKLIADIGEDESIQNVLLDINDNQKDHTMWLLKTVRHLPTNSVIIQNGTDKWKWRCWDCSIILKSRLSLLRHRLRHMPSHLWPHRCNICGQTFSQSGNLRHHILVHKGEHRFTCEHCGALFRHKSHFKTHSQQHNKDIIINSKRRFHCAICGKATKTRAHLVEHIRAHTLEKPYQCQTCGKSFEASSTYNRHMKTHKLPREKCLVCHQFFSDISALRRHEAIHNADKRHFCVCGQSFTQKSSLRRHEPICEKSAVPPPVKRFQCTVCLKTFIDNDGLKRHSATHTKEKMFSCINCGLSLKTPETLRNHFRRKHGNSINKGNNP